MNSNSTVRSKDSVIKIEVCLANHRCSQKVVMSVTLNQWFFNHQNLFQDDNTCCKIKNYLSTFIVSRCNCYLLILRMSDLTNCYVYGDICCYILSHLNSHRRKIDNFKLKSNMKMSKMIHFTYIHSMYCIQTYKVEKI